MTQKNNRPANRAAEISWGDCNQYTDRRRPAYRSGAAFITTAVFEHWRMRAYLLETETPGKFGHFTKEDAK